VSFLTDNQCILIIIMNTSNKKTDLPDEKGHSDDVTLDTPVDTGTLQEDLKKLGNASNTSVNSPNFRGSHSALGSQPAPESDDDVLKNAHEMGIAPNASTDKVTPLNLAKDLEDAEKNR